MSEQAPEPPRGQYQLQDSAPALEPGRQDFPQWPMTAKDALPFIPKVVA